jgi:NAD(P)-dependent dehydrogenase (short-subunit alcohol dehydrogenase family)
MPSRSFHALILGGTGAVGRELVQILARDDARVAFTYHENETLALQLRSVETGPDMIALPADLGSASAVETAVRQACEHLDGIDALIHAAAICLSPGDLVREDAVQKIGDIHETGWDRLMAINVKSVFFAVQTALPFLRKRGGGNIVLFSSISATKPTPSPVIYTASKAAMTGMAYAMAKELGPDNIRVNVIASGLLEAGVSKSLPRRLRDEYIKHCGLKREGKPMEIAQLAAWFARHNTYVTGQTILVDGAV